MDCFNHISVILWGSVSLVELTGEPGIKKCRHAIYIVLTIDMGVSKHGKTNDLKLNFPYRFFFFFFF